MPARRRKPTPRTVSIQPGIAELPPQRRHVHVDRLRRAVPARLPDLLEDPLAADGRARIGREQREQVELLRRQRELARRPASRGVPARRPRARPTRSGRCSAGRGSARRQHGPGCARQLAQAVRLDDVVVGAELEADDAVDLLAARGDDDDRHARALAQAAADLEAVDVGQAQVEQDEIGSARLERRLPGGGTLDLEAFPLEPFDERLGDRVLVLDDQELHVAMRRTGRQRRASGLSRTFTDCRRNPCLPLAPAPNRVAAYRRSSQPNGGHGEPEARTHDLPRSRARRGRRDGRGDEDASTSAGRLPPQPAARVLGRSAQRTRQLDRAEVALRKALEQKPPKLPPLPAAVPAGGAPSAAPQRPAAAARRLRQAGADHRHDPSRRAAGTRASTRPADGQRARRRRRLR